MNANELADELDEDVSDNQNTLFHPSYIRKIATMLRQQQAEIEALKIRELTDEEIHQLWDSCRTGIVYDQVQAFARAIPRKAQEQ